MPIRVEPGPSAPGRAFCGTVDVPTDQLDVGTAVFGHGQRYWKRQLEMDAAGRPQLRTIKAVVTFTDMDGVKHANDWTSHSAEDPIRDQ